MLDGDTVSENPGWPEVARTNDLVAAKDGVYGLVRGAGAVALWRTDGRIAERVSNKTMPGLRAMAADESGFWGVDDNGLWRSGNGRNWRRMRTLSGGRPINIMIHRGRAYVGGVGADGRGILWGPPPAPDLNTPAGSAPRWPPPPRARPIDWESARVKIHDIIAKPESYRGQLRNLAYEYSIAGPPSGFFEAALALPFPDREIGMFGGRFKRPAGNLARHILLWGMGVAGRGRVPGDLLDRPWTQKSNRPQKWFDGLPMALFAVTWTRQRDRETLARLIKRLDRKDDPLWLKGDIIDALSAGTGKRFAYDARSWRNWWANSKK